ncbi:hypothetical protein [Candidatus Methylacidiphilum fumarolicum]|uniref:hypothetical protein n=1 Tax=Candidatus Methylacidiphilum fumarolicum TaxID=591154 RepID=UPI0024B84AD5|nr:hypothetical protein [Candidatus Methylacidiphilum fumarolicum]
MQWYYRCSMTAIVHRQYRFGLSTNLVVWRCCLRLCYLQTRQVSNSCYYSPSSGINYDAHAFRTVELNAVLLTMMTRWTQIPYVLGTTFGSHTVDAK